MYDAVVIGSGPAGYECARSVGELGGKSVVIEDNGLGGTCTNHGCIPTKALHSSASFSYTIANSLKYGFQAPKVIIELNEIMNRKNKIVKIISSGVKKILEDAKVRVINGHAIIKDSNTVQVSEELLKTRNIVIASGAKPKIPQGIKINEVVATSKELLELKELPKSLVIIGGGYIGCEFATIFSNFGVKTTVLESMPSIIPNQDSDISKELSRMMKKQGINIFTKSEVTGIIHNKVKFKQDNHNKEVEGDKILIAIGLTPNFDKAEMDNIGIKYSSGIIIDNKMRTSVSNIYAIGDVTGKVQLAHYAYAQARAAAKNIMGQDEEFDESTIPSVIFTIPEISSVGECSSSFKSAAFNFAANGKARAMGEAEGFVKIFYDNGYLKGFCAIGPHVSDLVAEAALAIKNNISLSKIKDTIHAHPTLSESFVGAVEMALKD